MLEVAQRRPLPSATRTRFWRPSWSTSRRSAPKGLSARTLRALYNARDLMDAKFRHDPVNHATFMQILKRATAARRTRSG